MATLEREKPPSLLDYDTTDIANGVPAPFPMHLAHELLQTRATSIESAKPVVTNEPQHAESSTSGTSSSKYPRLSIDVSPDRIHSMEQEIRPTLAQVEQSCIMTLNNLLAQNVENWQPIVPTRRHSMPAQSPIKSSFQTNIPSSALHTLVQNICNCYEPETKPVELEDKSSLLEQLSSRITLLIDNGSVQPHDAPLIQSLLSLLTHISHVSNLSNDASHPTPIDFSHPLTTSDIYDTLRRQVLELQSHRGIQPDNVYRPPIEAVGQAILWHKIDDDLDEVFRLCRERTEVGPVPYSSADYALPPEYDIGDCNPPTYVPADYSETDSTTKPLSKLNKMGVPATTSQIPNGTMDEKMRLDFEAITMAIDRLYMVAPQLLNQRVELNRSKLEQMERARLTPDDSSTISSKRKGKAKDILGDRRMNKQDIQELEKMLDLINRGSSRRIVGQSVVLDGEQGMAERLEKVRQRELQKRDEFHARLVSHSNSRRLSSQDAEPRKMESTPPRIKNPNALLTLPEFIKESLSENFEQTRDPQALLTLPEFAKEPPPPDLSSDSFSITNSPTNFIKKSFSSRSRSLSAPPISLVRLLSGSGTNMKPPLTREKSADSHPDQTNGVQKAGLDVQYVAEHHDTLGSVAVFLDVNCTEAGANVEAEVFPGDRLIIKCGTRMSAPLALPAKVKLGKQDVRVQSGHFETKLECPATSSLTNGSTSYYADDDLEGGLLDATQLKDLNPTTFICASCSLPLIQGSTISRYNDLPSQHWAELLEAWMCHSDQKMADRVSLYANGLWPSPGQALVGGSYILFESGSTVPSNIRSIEASMPDQREDWQATKCICGAIVGRCIQRTTSQGEKSITYRLAKYSIRPVSPSSDPLKIPLSAFILQDIDEFVQAHATYRFVLSDEEEEKPRILIWVFKPHMRISYSASSYKFLSRTASVSAAKVHFKILGPSVSPTIKSTVEKYPGFSQSEQLVYPMDICRRIAGLLKESNAAYPQGRRIMGGLDVGWLVRS